MCFTVDQIEEVDETDYSDQETEIFIRKSM